MALPTRQPLLRLMLPCLRVPPVCQGHVAFRLFALRVIFAILGAPESRPDPTRLVADFLRRLVLLEVRSIDPRRMKLGCYGVVLVTWITRIVS